jgi:DNA replication and repair protein RecF
MYIKEIQLVGFRNYLEAKLSFNSPKTIIIGKNGQGKSNLLEVIQIFSHIKSRRAKRDSELVNFDLNQALIKTTIQTQDQIEEIGLLINKNGRRSLKINDVSHKPKDLLHHIYSVSFMVDDLEIINGSPSIRRDWLDSTIIQVQKNYSSILEKFEEILGQRNSFIKDLAENNIYHFNALNPSQKEQLKIWDQMFTLYANNLTQARSAYIKDLNPLANDYYKKISATQSSLELNYLGKLISQEDLEQTYSRDFARSCTNVGPHRDDIEIKLNDKLASSFASQGERRSAILAIKLAELEKLKASIDEYPILLLDDVLAELDEDRQDFLLSAIPESAQVIITTTHLGKHLEKWSLNAQILEVQKGMIKELNNV